MSIAKFLALPVVFAMLLACGEVQGSFEYTSSNSHNCTEKNCPSSSSRANSSSSFDIGLNWEPAPDSSYVHGSTQITLEDYNISRDLITQKQYKTVMGGENPSKGVKNDTMPIEGVNWFKAAEFCKKLSRLMGLDSNAVKLPTEAQWEYAAIPNVIQRNANYWEWTNDCWDNNFPYEPNNPSGPPNCLDMDYKVRKGFAKRTDERYATDPYLEDIGGGYISFRVALKKKFLN